MGTKIKKYQKRYTDYMFDHPHLRLVMNYIYTLFMAILSAFLFAFAFRAFISPSTVKDGVEIGKIVTGGASGLAQVFVLIAEICGVNKEISSYLQSIFYFAINIPIFILAWKGIGKKFAVFTLINVGISSLFISFLPAPFIDDIGYFMSDNIMARVVFAGVLIGLSSATAFKAEISAGGVDVVSYYFALRKSTSVGKYTIVFNAIVIISFSILTVVYSGTGDAAVIGFITFLFSCVYVFITALVVDFVNTRNKKVQVQIITTNQNMPHILLANIPHGATISKATGAFTGEDRLIIYMVVSSVESKKVIEIARQTDPHAFVNVINLQQVYGRFFIRPVK